MVADLVLPSDFLDYPLQLVQFRQYLLAFFVANVGMKTLFTLRLQSPLLYQFVCPIIQLPDLL